MEDIFIYDTGKKPEEIIEGLAEIRAATTAWVNYHQAKVEFERGCRDYEDMPAYIPGELEALRAKYPRAAAYLEAERWSFSGVPIKVRLGTRACKILLIGEDHDAVLDDMSKGLDAFYLAQQEG